MKTATKLLASLVVSSSLIMSSVMAFESHGKDHKGQGFKVERLVKKLSLTDEQLTQIQALIAEKKANKPEKPAMDKAAKKAKKAKRKAEMLAMFEAPSFDEAALREKIAARSEKRTESLVAKMSTQHAIYQLLDEEQRAKYLKILHKKHKKMKKGKKSKNKNG